VRPAEKGTLEATGLFRLYLLIYLLTHVSYHCNKVFDTSRWGELDLIFSSPFQLVVGEAHQVFREPEVRPGYHSSKACPLLLGFAS